MKIFHGSTVSVRRPSLHYGRKNTDFGKGFYATTDFDQAARWAHIKKVRSNSVHAVVSIYEIADDLLEREGLVIMRYNGATESWLNFVVENRKAKTPLHEYDIVLGPVANDKLYATISMYENGDLDVEAAIVQLKTHVLFNQVSFHSVKALGEIRFWESVVIE